MNSNRIIIDAILLAAAKEMYTQKLEKTKSREIIILTVEELFIEVMSNGESLEELIKDLEQQKK
jgi:hypothetical protein